MDRDELVECRHCHSDACYQFRDTNHIRWQCIDCGFYTNTLMLKNSELVLHLQETSPDLFNDISYLDEDGFVWYPLIINKPQIGVITPLGTNKDNWIWVFVPEVLIPIQDRYKYPVSDKPGEYHHYRTDMSLAKQFEQLDFILALKEANLLNDLIQ